MRIHVQRVDGSYRVVQAASQSTCKATHARWLSVWSSGVGTYICCVLTAAAVYSRWVGPSPGPKHLSMLFLQTFHELALSPSNRSEQHRGMPAVIDDLWDMVWDMVWDIWCGTCGGLQGLCGKSCGLCFTQ